VCKIFLKYDIDENATANGRKWSKRTLKSKNVIKYKLKVFDFEQTLTYDSNVIRKRRRRQQQQQISNIKMYK